MSNLSRRNFNLLLGSSALATAVAMPNIARAAKPRLVVVGGGAGGGTVARYVAKDTKGAVDVTLIEPSKRYYTCFFSNLYLGGFRSYDSIGRDYGKMATDHGVSVVHDWAADIDRTKKVVTLASGASVPYDRLVVSPGIDINYESVPGYSAAASGQIPHAWRSGTQVQLLKAQVENMREGGTFVMVAPPNPYRCPPGPYERISMIAHLLKAKNPKAKIVVLDPKEKFSKQALFTEGWQNHYPDMVEWLPKSITGGIKSVNVDTLEFETELETFKADAATIIPAQKAGRIAQIAGLTNDKGWCPINPATMQSAKDPNVYVVGDASVASAMPKSGFAANSQAKVAAMHARGELTGSKVFPARYANTCWSLIATDDGVKVGARYKAGDSKIEATDKFISKTGESADLRKTTYEESIGWYDGITADIFG
ncbi:MAG: NAD(P)/FAD-dependent oxidoreductase [Pseudomonadota bacterium]